MNNHTEDDYLHNGVEVYTKDGKSWGYDPVDESDVTLKDGKYYIDNGFHVYDYVKDEVDRIVAYRLYHTEEDGYIYEYGDEIKVEEGINV
jgi:hypothetical protein